MKKAVVIGAGQTGRGYAARFLHEKNYDITFLDVNGELVRLMEEDRAYSIHFYSKDRTPVYLSGFGVYQTHTPEAKQAIREADLILTSVGEQNLDDVAAQLKEGFAGKEKHTDIITVENGINPARVLRNHMADLGMTAGFAVSQTAVFCSTVVVRDTRLDILSQNETYFPYDADELGELDFDGAVPVHSFERFFQRKIYTYNCLAGLISYCGYIKGYEVFGEAANDPDVSETMDRLLAELNPALQQYFEITKEDQESFAQRALRKFKDLSILDYNVKNGRAAKRKLGPTERIISPMRILKEHGKDTRILEFVAAAALVYWDELQGNGSEPALGKDPIGTFCEVSGVPSDSVTARRVRAYLDLIRKNRDQIKIIDLVYSVR